MWSSLWIPGTEGWREGGREGEGRREGGRGKEGGREREGGR